MLFDGFNNAKVFDVFNDLELADFDQTGESVSLPFRVDPA